MANLKTKALANLAANGSTVGVQITGSHVNPTSKVNVRVHGAFGGGTITLEGSLDNAVWYSLGANAILTEAGGAELSIVEGEYLRATLAGAGGGENVDTDIILPGSANLRG